MNWSEFDGTSLPGAIRFLAEQSDGQSYAADPDDAPIFVLSAGWRSGSTLVQRLIASDASVLMWGEPFEDYGIVHRLTQTIELFGPGDAHLSNSIEHLQGALSNQWIANLNPGAAALRSAHRAFFETLFSNPAKARGYRRWGCKTVRLNANHAHYLRWVFPEAKFVFLIRHPLHSFASYRGRRWFYLRPGLQVRHSRQFLGHWQKLASSFLAQSAALGALVVRYEDLKAGNPTVDALGRHLGVRINYDVLTEKIGASADKRQPTNVWTRLVLGRQLGDLCDRLGYGLSGEVRDRAAGETAS
jgi:hypothetical protein